MTRDRAPSQIDALRVLAVECDRAARWLDSAAAGRPLDDTGPIPAHLATAVPRRLLAAWANAERSNATRCRTEANQLATRKARP